MLKNIVNLCSIFPVATAGCKIYVQHQISCILPLRYFWNPSYRTFNIQISITISINVKSVWYRKLVLLSGVVVGKVSHLLPLPHFSSLFGIALYVTQIFIMKLVITFLFMFNATRRIFTFYFTNGNFLIRSLISYYSPAGGDTHYIVLVDHWFVWNQFSYLNSDIALWGLTAQPFLPPPIL